MHLPLLSLPFFPKSSSYTQRLSRLSLIRPLRTFPSSSHSSSTLSPSCSVSRKTCRVSIPRRTPPLQINVRYHESASQSMIHTRALSIYFLKKRCVETFACMRVIDLSPTASDKRFPPVDRVLNFYIPSLPLESVTVHEVHDVICQDFIGWRDKP